MSRKRVAVTGLGCVSPLGTGADATWKALVSGESGAGQVTRFDTSEYSTKIACEVKIVPCRRRRRTARQLSRCGAERGAAFLDDAGGWRCHRSESKRPRHIAPQNIMQLGGRAVDYAVGGADRYRENVPLAKHPFGDTADYPEKRGKVCGGFITEMSIDNRCVIVRHDEAGHDSRRDCCRNGKYHVVVRQQRDAAAVESQFGGIARREADFLQTAAEANLAALARQIIQGGIHETFR